MTERQAHGHAPIVSVGDIAHLDRSGTVYVPTADQVGTIWKLLDSTAGTANSYEYDAFGVGRSASETVANRYRFGTKRLDAGATLYHFIARQYAPALARFLSRDVLDLGWPRQTAYGYVRHRAAVAVDPRGMWTEIERTGSSRARTCAERDADPVSSLALRARMDLDEAFRGWKGRHDSGWLMTDRPYTPVLGPQQIRAGEWYTVPNCVEIHFLVLWPPYWYTWEQMELRTLRAQGFCAFELVDSSAWTVTRGLEEPETHGLIFIAHGPGEDDTDLHGKLLCSDYGEGEGGGIVSTTTASLVLHHRLGCLKLVTCYGGCANWAQFVSGYTWAVCAKVGLYADDYPGYGC